MKKELLKTRAYAIFVEEISRQISSVREIINQLEDGKAYNCEEAKSIFHTIKGGSGFFGLDEIFGAASKLETIFIDSASKPGLKVATINKLLKQIEKSILKLPSPEPSPESGPVEGKNA